MNVALAKTGTERAPSDIFAIARDRLPGGGKIAEARRQAFEAYERAGLTLNFIRSLVEGGFADLHHHEYWDVSFAKGTPHAAQYERIVESIRESLDFVAAITGMESEVLRRVDVFTSHEALALPYEQAQTRQVPRRSAGLPTSRRAV